MSKQTYPLVYLKTENGQFIGLDLATQQDIAIRFVSAGEDRQINGSGKSGEVPKGLLG